MLSRTIQATEQNASDDIDLPGEGGHYILDAPATHLTEHPINFKYDFPLGLSSQNSYTLRLRSLDWQKFFWYDEQKWTIENALNILGKPLSKRWPLLDEEELKVKRISYDVEEKDIIYNTQPSREFSCTLNLEVAPWGMFINATGVDICIGDLTHQPSKQILLTANSLEMLFNVSQGFTIGIRHDNNWMQSLPIFFENTSANHHYKRYYVITETDATDIVILRGNEVLKFVLKLKIENESKIFKLSSKFGIVNYYKSPLSILPFAMDHKENVARTNVQHLDEKAYKTTIASSSPEWENSLGIALTTFYDINSESSQRSVDSAFVYFVVIKLRDDTSSISMPIALALPFHRKSISIQDGKESVALMVSLIEHENIYYLTITEDVSPAVLVNNQTDCAFVVAQTNAPENSKVSSTTPEYEGKHLEWFHMILQHSKCYYTPPEWYTRFPEVESTLCNITLALYDCKFIFFVCMRLYYFLIKNRFIF